MNIDTSSAVSSTSTTSTSSVKQNSRTSKTDSSAFEDEMKTASSKEENAAEKTEQVEETEQTEENKQADETQKTEEQKETSDKDKDKQKNDDKIKNNNTLKGELTYNDDLNDTQSILSKNIQSLLNTSDRMSFNNTDFSSMQASLNYQTVSMDANDAMFFTDLVKNTDMSMQSISGQLSQLAEVNVQAAEKTAKVSSTMMNLLSDSLKTNQPFRIDFDKDVSVIIKVNRDGSIMANFIPGDRAVEEYLKNNIGFLRQRFDEENLPYSQLSYSKHKQQQEQQNKDKKENADE